MLNVSLGKQLNKPIVVALGFFDCMHKGHLALYNQARRMANENDALCALVTFENNHFKVIGLDVLPIYTFEERLLIYQNVGVDVVLSAQFDRQFMSLTAEQFLKIFDNYDVKHVVCGFDYTCGCDRKDSQFVSRYFNNKGIDCSVVSAVLQDNVKISSTLVRKLLTSNCLAEANRLLSEPYFIVGNVVEGRKVGRKINFPTANVNVGADKLLPVGVYHATVDVEGVTYDAIVNIGAKPTFGIDKPTVEAHLVGFEGNLYGKKITLRFVKYLRSIVKFENESQLANQLLQDVARVTND